MGALSSRSSDDLSKLFMLCRESITSDALHQFHQQAQILNRHVIAELLLSDAMIGSLRKEMRRLFAGLKTSEEELRGLLTMDVIKRDALDGEPAKAAKATLRKAANALAKKASKAAALASPA
jgi:hypothetical protein